MAQSSPGQPRPFDPMGQLTTTGSLSDVGADPVQYIEDTGVLFEQQDAPLASRTSPDRRADHQHDLHNDAADFTASTSTMLLEKPSSLFKPLDLDKGYEYGPAVQFAPGYFTKMPGKPATTLHGDQSRPPENKTSSRPTAAVQVPVSYFPSQDGGNRTENATTARPVQLNHADREVPLRAKNGVAERSNTNPLGGSTATGQIPPPISKPPFPDTSPKSSTQPFAPPQHLRSETKSTTTLNKPTRRTQPLTNGQTQHSEPPSGQKQNVSSPMAHGYNSTSPHHIPPEPGHQPQHPRARRAERDQKHHHHPMPTTERPTSSTRELADVSQSHMANRPLKDWTQVRPVRPTHRARPVSRGSNVSKQR